MKAKTANAAFWGMQTAGLFGAFVMLLTAMLWHKVARRHSSWFNFMATWLISCASYLLTMNYPSDRQPNHALCLLQASLIYSVPSLTSGATVALVIHVYLTLRSLLTASRSYNRIAITTSLIVAPYIPAWAVFTITLALGLSQPSIVLRPEGSAYCDLASVIPGRVSAVLVATFMTVCLGIEIAIIRAMRRAWETLRTDRGSKSIILRVLAFTLVGMNSIILSLVFLALPDTTTHHGSFNIVIATIPISSVVIFGTQKDILTAWYSALLFIGCRRRTEHGADTWDSFTPTETRQTFSAPAPARVSQIEVQVSRHVS